MRQRREKQTLREKGWWQVLSALQTHGVCARALQGGSWRLAWAMACWRARMPPAWEPAARAAPASRRPGPAEAER